MSQFWKEIIQHILRFQGYAGVDSQYSTSWELKGLNQGKLTYFSLFLRMFRLPFGLCQLTQPSRWKAKCLVKNKEKLFLKTKVSLYELCCYGPDTSSVADDI